MPPKGRRNRDWSGTTEPLPEWKPNPTKGKPQSKSGHPRKAKGKGKRRRHERRAAGHFPWVRARIPLPPPEPWHSWVPPWYDSREAFMADQQARQTEEDRREEAQRAARQRQAAQLNLYHNIEAIDARVAAGESAESLATSFGVALEDMGRFLLLNGNGRNPHWPPGKIPKIKLGLRKS